MRALLLAFLTTAVLNAHGAGWRFGETLTVADRTEAAPGHPWPPRHSRILRISGAAVQGCTGCGFADRTEATSLARRASVSAFAALGLLPVAGCRERLPPGKLS